ncbi:hypothetical protein MLD38_019174 [Melastoma candidum]|uniref:Uncharacterized protein n=1 Tax=Melastoma candidum TaxID=119954 RepID=A0ACB9QWC6_9MYRT|nr:hypothetical protein MLD38_019174 [Melastoma candidum]
MKMSVVVVFAALLLPSAVLSLEVSVYSMVMLPNNTIGPAYITFLPGSPVVALTGISNGDYGWNGTLCDNNTSPSLFGTCGRALGIATNTSGFIYFCDAYKGLFGVGPSGGPATLLFPYLFFCNAVDIDSIGMVYFTDGSQKYRNNSLARINDTSGRLLRYDPNTRDVTVLATGLATPTGIALSSDNSYILITQLIKDTILKFYITGPKVDSLEVFARNIPGASNVRRSLDGSNYYVPQNPKPYSHFLLRINSTGNVQANLSIAGPYSNIAYFRDARPVSPTAFYIGSQYANFLGVATIFGF